MGVSGGGPRGRAGSHVEAVEAPARGRRVALPPPGHLALCTLLKLCASGSSSVKLGQVHQLKGLLVRIWVRRSKATRTESNKPVRCVSFFAAIITLTITFSCFTVTCRDVYAVFVFSTRETGSQLEVYRRLERQPDFTGFRGTC